jgi:hypothetical protein
LQVTIAANTISITARFAYGANYLRSQRVEMRRGTRAERGGRAERVYASGSSPQFPDEDGLTLKLLGGFGFHCGRRDELKPR